MNPIYLTSAASGTLPNILPEHRHESALCYNDPNPLIVWGWSLAGQTWVQLSFVASQVEIGTGAPAAAPVNPLLPATYTDRATKILYTWDPTVNAWL